MSAHLQLYNPYTLDLSRQIEAFVSSLNGPHQGHYSPSSPIQEKCSSYLRDASSPSDILSRISELLAVPQLTWRIEKYFRPLLFDIAARWLLLQPDIHEHKEWYEARLEALTYLVEVHEELYP